MVDGEACINSTTARGWVAYSRTPNGDVYQAVQHCQFCTPLDFTEAYVKAEGNDTEKRIAKEMNDCRDGDSTGECARLLLLLSGADLDDVEAQWQKICSGIAGLCYNQKEGGWTLGISSGFCIFLCLEAGISGKGP